MNKVPREIMESCLAAAQEATMQGFGESVLACAITPFVQRMMDTCYRMGFESGWRIREQQDGAGVPPTDGGRIQIAGNADAEKGRRHE